MQDLEDSVAAAVYKLEVAADCPLQPAVLSGAMLQLLLWLWAVHGIYYFGGRELPGPPEISTAGPTLLMPSPVPAEQPEAGGADLEAADQGGADEAHGKTCLVLVTWTCSSHLHR